jgi:DNA-binding response OmpR family regulator
VFKADRSSVVAFHAVFMPEASQSVAVRVLVAEDEEFLADAIARGLRKEGMAVDVAVTGDDALDKAMLNPYDVIVLDRDLPGLHGDDVCTKLIAADRGARILMLTAASAVDDRVNGLTLGADDYLGKPFAFTELVARLRAIARRPETTTPSRLERGDVVLDVGRHEAARGDRTLALTPKELGVLRVLLEADGVVVSSETLLDRVWDEHADPFTNTVRVTIANLRRKLGGPPIIETVFGAGYRIP